MENKICSRCNESKEFDKFVKKRNICKDCANKWAKIAREKRYNIILEEYTEILCNVCNISKKVNECIKTRYLCKECYNSQYRDKYKNDDIYREKIKIKDKNKNREVTNKAQNKRYQTNPVTKFIAIQRSRINIGLKNKQKHTIEYLGCNAEEYYNWLLYNFNKTFNFENHGKEWHIDHVIPIHKFNLENEEEQLIAFNWRNTMPLSAKKNLSKNNKIIPEQIQEHFQNLKKYHEENNIELPQEFINLFAKHPVAGSP